MPWQIFVACGAAPTRAVAPASWLHGPPRRSRALSAWPDLPVGYYAAAHHLRSAGVGILVVTNSDRIAGVVLKWIERRGRGDKPHEHCPPRGGARLG